MEELEWRQRSKALWLKEGDNNNTKFFHKMANQRRRINAISSLVVGDETFQDDSQIAECLVDHFLTSFKKDHHWRPTWVDDLEAPFGEEEIKTAIFGADGDKASGLDGFNMRFFQEYWGIVKEDIIEMFSKFYEGNQRIGCLNSSVFILIRKKDSAERINDYRPICLVNGVYMMIAKVLNIRLRKMISQCINSAKASMMTDNRLHDYFPLNKGLRQGEPLSPMLFILVASVLNRMFYLAINNRWLKGLACSVGGRQITHLLYADDTLLLGEANEDNIRGF
ncbi:hypothetical protein QJS10_CPA10g01214 [Acorus calamus]|uniref:Reverse transcriptase domain-containing protein n=1 Tax=Acorus calamus TaxID=4465 RepID=A0AAV9E2W6_ACOCL|nr:hypothetical protein QJS10_CPA10g01214 [Acorus calamus]